MAAKTAVFYGMLKYMLPNASNVGMLLSAPIKAGLIGSRLNAFNDAQSSDAGSALGGFFGVPFLFAIDNIVFDPILMWQLGGSPGTYFAVNGVSRAADALIDMAVGIPVFFSNVK